jgi:hypothetical protein
LPLPTTSLTAPLRVFTQAVNVGVSADAMFAARNKVQKQKCIFSVLIMAISRPESLQ